MGVSADAPSLDLVYKLTEYGGRGRLKLSSGKPVLPGAKQVFRFEEAGVAVRDVIAGADEELGGRPLLEPVMEGGRRVGAGRATLEEARDRARREVGGLPRHLLDLEPGLPAYPVEVSPALEARLERVRRTVSPSEGEP